MLHGRGDRKIQLVILVAVAAALLGTLAPAGLGNAVKATNLVASQPPSPQAPSIIVEAAVAKVPDAPVAPKGAISPAFWAPAPVLKTGAANAPEVSGLAAVVIDEASGEVLFDKNAHQPLPPASLTKIATLTLALEYGGFDEEVVSDVDGFSMRGSTIMGLEVGDRFPLRDLLFGMMLPSGNDAALVIGRHIAGSDAAFVAMMNNLRSVWACRTRTSSTRTAWAAVGSTSRLPMTWRSFRATA